MDSMTLTGIVQHILFSSPSNDYTVLKLVPDDEYNIQNEDGTATVVGDMPDSPQIGDALSCEGGWTDHPHYGTQFRITSYERAKKSPAHVPPTGTNDYPPNVTPISTVQGDKLRGTVMRITFYNESNSWGVIKIDPFEDADFPEEALEYDGAIAVVGVMPELVEGEVAEFTGKWVTNQQYGKQFKCDAVIPIAPKNKQGIVRYIADTVYGIGDVTATRIFNHFGEDTLDILDNDPQRIYDVPGLKPQLAENLLETWSKNRAERQTMIYLQSFGVTSRLAKRIIKSYTSGDDPVPMISIVQRVQADPYVLADDIHGIGFKRADQIAQSMGVALDAPQRLRAGLVYTLTQLARDGHTYAPYELLVQEARVNLGVDTPDDILQSQLDEQLLAGKLLSDHLPADDPANESGLIRAIYLPTFYNAEVAVADKLRVLANSPSHIMTAAQEMDDWDAFLADLAEESDIQLSPHQQGAVQGAMLNKISVLTGGPGTGKTTTLRMVINALDAQGYEYALASPTGRAAKRLGEATERDASTIHRLLGFNPAFGGFDYDESNPLEAEIIIIDEASMIDLQLFDFLLRAIAPGAHLMLVGDIDQLPSVGAGNVLNDVIDSGIAHVTRLNQIFRQGDGSHIVLNAHRINQGQMPLTDNESDDFFFFNMPDPDDAADMIVDLVNGRLERVLGSYNPIEDVQVIAPMYRSSIGVNRLNELLQDALNPPGRRAEKKFGNKVFRAGDKVMQTKNNYEKDVFNGDIGIIYGIDDDENVIIVTVDGRHVNYTYEDADEQLIHAYCISTHRSQGSEYSVVVMPVMTQHYMMLQRNLLYTAITRAKQMVVLVGTRKAIFVAVDNNKVSERYSGLLPRLRMDAAKTSRAGNQQRLL